MGSCRPVAVGEVLRRLCSKALATKVAADAAAYLTPLQFGVGVRGGCEAVVHATREVLADITLTPQQRGHLVVDLDSGFNTGNWRVLLEEVKTHFPQLYPWVVTCYGQHSHLKFGDLRLTSQAGVQQGHPLRPLFFALLLQPVLLQPVLLKVQYIKGLTLNA